MLYGFKIAFIFIQNTNDHIASAATALNLSQPMDTVFVKEVRPNGPAFLAGLKTGDRLLSVNGMQVAGTPYNRVVASIQQAPRTLSLQVVPKECDILQTVSVHKQYFIFEFRIYSNLFLFSISVKLLIIQRRTDGPVNKRIRC